MGSLNAPPSMPGPSQKPVDSKEGSASLLLGAPRLVLRAANQPEEEENSRQTNQTHGTIPQPTDR
jgi:hypothetical protein